jgi:Zn finger protein HypA/HybF involved in hydrogenase expression
MNTYICVSCKQEFDMEGMAWNCPHCNASASEMFYIGKDIPEVL